MTTTSERSPAPSPASGGRGAKRPGLGTRIATYNRQIVAELRKVIWPTRKELVTYTYVVLIFVLFMIGFVSLADYVFSKGILKVFG